ncbi:MAG: hypothetical protein WCF69_01710 [Mycobacterium sp.]
MLVDVGCMLRNAAMRTAPERLVIDEITRWAPTDTTGPADDER